MICLRLQILSGMRDEIEKCPIFVTVLVVCNMPLSKTDILRSIKYQVQRVVPGAKVILFGSRARGDERPDSDWDILILVDKPELAPTDFDTISYPVMELGWQMGEFFSPKLYTVSDWMKRSFTPFYKNIEAEGITL